VTTQTREVTRQYYFVDGFQQSGTQLLMYTHAGCDDGSGNRIHFFHPRAPVLPVSLCENDGVILDLTFGHGNV
jgi:hypothetical protein